MHWVREFYKNGPRGALVATIYILLVGAAVIAVLSTLALAIESMFP